MKKTLIAAGVAAALCGASQAADIQLYGLINTGLSYVHTDADVQGVKNQNKFSMETSKEFGSRWGIRGTEDLGNGYSIGFVLESGFESDTGSLDTKVGSSRIFGRESRIDLKGDFGKLSVGVLPLFGSVLGADGLFRAIDPIFANYTVGFGSGHVTASNWTRVDNAVSYVSPTFAGLTFYGMYSLKNKSNGDNTPGQEGNAESDRYASLAMRYQNAGLEAILVADTTMYGSLDSKALAKAGETDYDGSDGYTVTLGGNYTFDNGLKVISFVQWFDNQFLNHKARAGVTLDGVEKIAGKYGLVDGWGASLGVNMPLAGGTVKGQIGYRDMDNQDDASFKRMLVAAAYDYPFSKRTSAYVMAGYGKEKVENKAGTEASPSGYEVTFGLLHRF